MTLPAIVESGLNEAGTAVAVIVHPERRATAILEYVNEPFAAVMRKKRPDLTGATFQKVLEFVGKTECRERLLQSLQDCRPIEIDVVLVVGGVESWLGLRLSYPPPGVSGVRYAVLIGRDITKIRQNATQEDKMRQMLAQIFMRINAPVTIVGWAGEMVMCNAAFRHLTGFSADELKHMRKDDLTPPDLLDSMTKMRENQFATGERYEIDAETLVKGGRRVPVRMTSILLKDNDQSYRVVTMIPRTVASAGPAPAPTAAQAYATQDKGELQAISLAALQTVFGADWERIAVRAMQRAEQLIRKRLDRDDVVGRVNEAEFVLWFSSADVNRNSVTLQTIVRDIRRSFLTEFGEEISSHVTATLVPGTQDAARAAGATLKRATLHYTSPSKVAARSAVD